MGTLRIYGDSFSADLGFEWQYINQLAKYLNMPVVNTSLFGCANEWIIKNLLYDLKYDQIKPDDFVLIVTTSETREWLFQDIPDIGNFSGISDLDASITPKQSAAIRAYITHLHNPSLAIQRHFANSALIKNLLQAVEQLGCRTLLLPGFLNPYPAKESAMWLTEYIYRHSPLQGCLNDVCMQEFDDFNKTGLEWYKKYNLPDIRPNHMLKQNHNILFEKIKHSLEHNTEIDLTTGFTKGVITANKMHQYWSYRGETAEVSYWQTRTSKQNFDRMKQLLARLSNLESDNTLPYHRSMNH